MRNLQLLCIILSGVLLSHNFLHSQLLRYEAMNGRGEYALARVCDKDFIPAQFGLDAEGLAQSGICAEFPASAETIVRIRAAGFAVETLIADLTAFYSARAAAFPARQIADANGFRLGSMGGYLTLAEIYADFARMKAAHPAAVSEPIRIGSSVENRPIYAYRISLSPANNSAPEILFTALHHAREPGSVMALTYFLWNLLENSDASSHEAAFLLRHRVIWCIPVVNPDGYEFNRSTSPDGGGLWRKNRANVGSYLGVDLNRNYGPEEFWNSQNNGSSLDPRDETYRGKQPFSEPETQAIRDFIAARQFSVAINYHTYGNACIYPFSHSGRETDDSALFRNLGAEITRKNKFSLGRDLETLGYGVRGGSDDFLYSASGILSLTSESGSRDGGFWARPDRIEALAADNLYANYQAAWSAGANLRPIETLIEWINDTNVVISAIIMNVGARALRVSSSARLSPLMPGITPLKKEQNLSALRPAQSDVIQWRCIVERSVPNGAQVKLILEVAQEETARFDTLKLYVRRPEILTLFEDSADARMWNLGSWGARSGPDGASLDDSPNGYYPSNSANAAIYKQSIDLRNSVSASLSFAARWSFAFKKDVAVVEASTTGGRTWKRLLCNRMREDVALPDTLGGGAGAAFSGNFPIWEQQECSLNEFCGKEILARFVVGAEPGATASGISLKHIKIERYAADTPKTLDDMSSLRATTFPSPASSLCYVSASLPHTQMPNGTQIELSVFTTAGNMIFQSQYKIDGGNEIIMELPVAEWTPGLYFIRVQSSDISIYNKIAVAR